MPGDEKDLFSEFGGSEVKKASDPFAEFGGSEDPQKKKITQPLVSQSPLSSSVGALESTTGNLDSSGNPNYFQGGNFEVTEEVPFQPGKNLPPETTLDPSYQPIQNNKFVDTPDIRDVQENNPDLMRAVSSPSETTAKDQENFDPALAEKIQKQSPYKQALARGVLTAGSYALKAPAGVYDMIALATNKVINNPLNYLTNDAFGKVPSFKELGNEDGYYKSAIRDIDDVVERSATEKALANDGKTVKDYFMGDNPDYSKGFSLLGQDLLEMIPTSIALGYGIATNPAMANVVGGGAFIQDAKMRLDSNPELAGMPENDKATWAAIMGGTEMATENLGIPKLPIFKDILKKGGKEALDKAGKELYESTMEKILRRYIGPASEEVGSELLNNTLQNIYAAASGEDPDRKPFDNSLDVIIHSAALSGALSAPTIITDVFKSKKSIKKVGDIAAQKESLIEDLNNPEASEATKEIISVKIQDLNEEASEIAADEKKKFSELTPEGQEQINGLVTQSKRIAEAANDPNVSEETREALTKDVNKIDGIIDGVFETAKQPKVQDPAEDETAQEIDFLNTLNDEVGLDADQAARLAELETKNVPRNVPQRTTTEKNVPQEELEQPKSKTNGEKTVQTEKAEVLTPTEAVAQVKEPEATATTETTTKPTDNATTETIGPEKVESSQEEVASTEESPGKKAKQVAELVEEEEPDVKDTPEALQKLDDEIAAMKVADKKVMDQKFVGMVERAYKMKVEGKISRPTYTAFKHRVKDVYQGKKNIDAEELKLRSTDFMNKVKEKLLGQGYEKLTLSSAVPITPKTVADLIDLTNSIIHKIIDAGAGAVSLAEATAKALKIVQKHPTYRKLTASKELDEKVFTSELGKMKDEKKEPDKKEPESKERKYGEDPSQSGESKKKSLVNRLFNAEDLSQTVRNKIESFGLNYTQFSNDEANEISKKIIDTHGLEGALGLARANGEIPGGVKTMIYANIINEYNAREAGSKNDFDRNFNANQQGVIANELDQFLRDSGRIISAVQKFYELSPAGIASKEIAGLVNENKKKKNSAALTEKKEDVIEAVRKAEARPLPKSKPLRDKIKEIKTKRSKLIDDLKASFSAPSTGPQMKSSLPIQDKQVILLAKIAGTYIEEGVVRVDALIKKIKRDFKKATGEKLEDSDLERVMNHKLNDKETVKDKIQEVSDKTPLTEKEKELEKAAKLAVLDKMMPRSRRKTSRERKQDHEKMLTAMENGVFDGASRTYKGADGKPTTETFEDLFYEQHGITNVNKPEFREKMKSLAEDIFKTPKGANSMRNQAYQAMYNYISQNQTKTRLASSTDLLTDIWYAHILSSYETHIRNMKYNATTVALSQTALLAEKKLLAGQFNEFREIMSDALKGLSVGRVEAWQVLANGAVSRFDKPAARGPLESTKSKILGLHKYPGRALRAADILSTVPLYEMKQRELMYDFVRREAAKEGKNLTKEQIRDKVTEYLGKTPKRIATAEKKAAEDVEKVYGQNWKTDKKAVAHYKIRVAEVMEETRPEAIKEEAIQWAKRSVLTNEPRGIYKNISNSLHEISHIPGVKFIVPFINIVMNLTDRMIERSPAGFVNAMRGKKGFGKTTEELSKDEVKELLLKSINYTVGVAALIAAFGDSDEDDDVVITGNNTGNYSKNQSAKEGGKKDPYSVYVNGKKVYEYKDSPLSSLFAPVGYYRDYVKYGENEGPINGMIQSALSYLGFVIDQNAMKGLNNFFNAVSPQEYRKLNAEGIGKTMASWAQNFYAPNILKAFNNDVRGAMGYDNKKVDEWHDAFFKDIPYVETLMLGDDYDHLGQPIKDQFKAPAVPFEKWQAVDPYYKFFTDHGFYPTHMKDKNLLIGDEQKEVELTKDQLRKLEKFRGDIVKDILNSEVEDGVNLMEEMKGLDNETFDLQMKTIFSKAGKLARTRMFNGEEVRSTGKVDDELKKESESDVRSAIQDIVNSLE